MNERARILEADKRFVFRPYTGTDEHAAEDSIVVVDAAGPTLIDADGRRFFDASGAWWTNHLGYQHPRLVAAVARQAQALSHAPLAGATHAQAALLAEALAEATGLARVFYSDDGSTSVEVAVKTVFQYFAQNGEPERTRFLALPAGYHGDTIGAMSLGALDAFTHVHAPLLFDVTRAPEPDAGPDGFARTFAWLAEELARDAARIAGVFIEPLVQGAAGMRMYPPALLTALADATRRAGALLVLDEVFTGFGRTGTMFAHTQADITPDVLCLSKGLTGGTLPFAATLVNDRVYDGFRGDKRRALMHGHTFCGNPLGAAVAREVLAVYAEEQVLERAQPKMRRLRDRILALGERPGVRNARALGMIGAVDLGEAGYFEPLGARACARAREAGMLMRPLGNTVYIVPPLVIADGDLDTMLDIFDHAVTGAT